MPLQFIKAKAIFERVDTPEFIQKSYSKVQSFFKKEKLKSPHLFDGPLLFTRNFSTDVLQVFQGSYAYFLAQKKCPEIFDFPFYSLAITGLGKRQDSYLLGLRANDTYQEAGSYEWVPSGGMDPTSMGEKGLEVEKCFYQELEEECALKAFHLLTSPQIEGLLLDEKERLIDIVFSYSLDTKKVPEDPWEGNGEYQKLLFLPKEDIKSFIEINLKNISPSMRVLSQTLIVDSLSIKSDQVNWSVGKK